jgi:hypothetical protein
MSKREAYHKQQIEMHERAQMILERIEKRQDEYTRDYRRKKTPAQREKNRRVWVPMLEEAYTKMLTKITERQAAACYLFKTLGER